MKIDKKFILINKNDKEYVKIINFIGDIGYI